MFKFSKNRGKLERHPVEFTEEIGTAIRAGEIKTSELSLRDMAEELIPGGRDVLESWDPALGGNGYISLAEAEATTSRNFSNITGQIVYAEIMQAYEDPNFLHPMLVNDVQTPFSGEKIAGITRLGDKALTVPELQEFPLVGLSEDYIETPSTTKYGFIVPLSKESVFFDRTGDLTKKASESGYWLGVHKEKRVLNEVFGITNTYKRLGQTDNTYGNTHTSTGDFDNLAGSNALVDYTDIEAAELLFDGITDPNTGEPILVTADTIIYPTALKHTVNRILDSIGIQFGKPGSTSDTVLTNAPNPVGGLSLTRVTGPMVKNQTSSASTWYIGQPKKAFSYRQNWPITPAQAPPNAFLEFNNDVITQFKISEMGSVATLDPRYMVKCTAS